MSSLPTGQPGRPLGWWVKQVDRELDALFERALDGTAADRRTWQVLSSLAAPTTLEDLVAALAAFDPAEAVRARVAELLACGWLEDRQGALQLTLEGERQRAALARLVAGVREQVSSALGPQGYQPLIGLLEQLVQGLRPQPLPG